jgi:hypothetical protein
MSGVPYHAWTHRPKAQGGTDPIPVLSPPAVWAYMDTYNGQPLPANDWWIVEDWEEFYCSPGAGDGSSASLLYPEPGGDAFVMWFDQYDTGTSFHLVEFSAVFSENVDPAIPGDMYGIGNLVQSGGSLDSLDKHEYQDAYMLNQNSFDHCFTVCTMRPTWNTIGDHFYATELGNFCGANVHYFDIVTLTVYRLDYADGAASDLVYVTP